MVGGRDKLLDYLDKYEKKKIVVILKWERVVRRLMKEGAKMLYASPEMKGEFAGEMP